MSKKWSEVAGSDGFKSLQPEQQDQARRQYFDEVVAPQVPQEHVTMAWDAFSTDSGMGRRELPKDVAPSTAGAGRGSLNPVAAAPIAPAPTKGPSGSVLEDVIFKDPQLDPELNRQAMLKSSSPGSVMFTAGRGKQNADQAIAQGKRAPLQEMREAKPVQERGFMRAAGDTAIGLTQGALGMAKGVADNINAGDNPVSDFYEGAIKAGDRLKSDDLRDQQVKRDGEIYLAGKNGGEAGEARASFNSMFSYPGAGADVVARGAGSMIPTVGLGLAGAGTKLMGATNALSNAGDAASQTADALRQLPPSAWQKSEDYRAMVKDGASHDEAVSKLAPWLALPAQIAGGATGFITGSTGLEKVLAGKSVGNSIAQRAGRAGVELLGEQAETLAPQMVGNAAVGELDGVTGITKGLGRAAVETAAGALPGSALAAKSVASLDVQAGAEQIARQKGFLAREQRIKTLNDAGDTATADLMQKKHDRLTAIEEVDGELQRMPSTPEFANSYRNLRGTGMKPAEAAARSAVTTTFQGAAVAAGIPDAALTTALEKANGMPLDEVPTFLQKFTAALEKRGLAQPGAVNLSEQLEAARDDAIEAAMGAVYQQGDIRNDMNDVLAMEGQTSPVLATSEGNQPQDEQESESSATENVATEQATSEWQQFTPETGTLNIPRAEMPQVKNEHRGAMVNFLNARGVEHEIVEVDPTSLKPTQAEFSPDKVAAAKEAGGNRAILISNDGHIIDGHHQALAKLESGEPVKAIRLDAPAADLIPLVNEFPSSTQAPAAPVPKPQPKPFAELPDLDREQQQQLESSIAADSEREYQQSIKEAIQVRLGLIKPTESTQQKTPFKTFLRQYGIAPVHTSDIAGNNRFKANNMLPATFRAGGLDLDALVERAIERGFMTEADRGDQGKLISMIQSEIAGDAQVSTEFADQDASVQTERAQRMEIEGEADKLGMPYSADITTDRLASMVNRVQVRLEKEVGVSWNGRGTLKSERVLAQAKETVARIERKRAKYNRELAQFAEVAIGVQDFVLEAMTDNDGNPVIVRAADINALEAWLEENQQWDNGYGTDTRANQDSGQAGTSVTSPTQAGLEPTAQAGPEEQRGSPGTPDQGQEGSAGSSEGLTATTPEQVKADQERAAKAEKAAKAKKRADDELARKEQERKDIAARSASASDSFVLGGDALQNLSGQGSMFDEPARPEADAEQSPANQSTGDFGPILTQYRHDAQGAIKALTELQDGEAVAALQHPEVGDIDLVWGKSGTSAKEYEDGHGLAKISIKHPEVLKDLQGFLLRLHKDNEQSGKNRIRLVDDKGTAVVRLQWNGNQKIWLLTAFENEVNPAADGGRTGVSINAETATPAEQGAGSDGSVAKPAAESKPAKIEDSGEVLEGARKLYAKNYAAKLDEGTGMDTAAVPLSKSWPEPDYQRLIDEGTDPWAVAMARAMRDEVPTKPSSSWKLRGWVQKVEALRDMMAKVMSGEMTKEKFKTTGGQFNLADWFNKIDLYEAVGHANSLKGLTFGRHEYGMYGGQTYSPAKALWTINMPSKSASATWSNGNWGNDLAVADTKAEAIEKFKVWSAAQVEAPPAEAKATSFDIYSYRSKPNVFIVGKRISSAKSVDLKEFPTAKEARAYVAANQAELERLLAEAKFEPSERGESNAPRVGADHRNGADVTTEQFRDTFGFRGEQFGASMPQGERQANMNQAYDALMDLAGVVGIPPKALSLNGELGLAFGARGVGGKNPAAAHYERDTTGAVTPNRVVINLTRKNGAGSLAHEWFHAVDNYFARMRGEKAGMLTESYASRGEGVRPEMVTAFKQLMTTIQLSGVKERSKQLDKKRVKDYWSTGLEMAARSFESYVIAKLQDKNGANDYLANIVPEELYTMQGSYPYPVMGEMPAIRAAFDNFFDAVQTKDTDFGVAMFSRATSVNKGQSVSDTQAQVNKITAKQANGPRTIVVATPADLPVDAPDDVRGMYLRGTVYVVASTNSNAREVASTLAHETIAHHGLRNMLGREGWLKLMGSIQLALASGNKPLNAIRADIRKAYVDENGVYNLNKNQESDEISARAVEDAIDENGEFKPGFGMIKQAYAKLAQFLRDMGFTVQFTNVELQGMLVSSMRNLETGARTQGGVSVAVAASRSDTPALKRVEVKTSTTDFDGNDGAFARGPSPQANLFQPTGWSMPDPTKVDRLIYELQDGRVDLKRAQAAIEQTGQKIVEKWDARLAETLYPGRVAYRSKAFLDTEVKPLLEAMARQNLGMDELADYLHARGAEERNKQIAKVNPAMPDGGAGTNTKGDLMTTQAARDYLANVRPARKQVLDAMAKRVDAITGGTRALLVTEGLEKQSTIDAWEGAYKNYVPMFRDEAEAGAPHPQGSGFSVRGSATKRATGSTKEVTNILAHVLMQREAAITRAEKNRVGLALYGQAMSHPNPEFWTTIKPSMKPAEIAAELVAMGVDPLTAQVGMEGVPTIRTVDPITDKVVDRPNPMYKSLPGAIPLRINGEDRVLMLNVAGERGARMAASLKNMDGLTELDIAGSIVGKSTRWLASVNTQFNPAFGLTNLTRDVLGGVIHLGNTELRGKALKVLLKTPVAIVGIARELASGGQSGKWQTLYRQFQADGGQTGFKENFRDPNERAKAIESELKGLGRASWNPSRAAHAILSLLDGFNTTLENAVRLSAYSEALDKGISRANAARLGRELTVDFNRKGRMGAELGPLYAFFNASVQGSARSIQALKGPTGAKIISGGLGIGVAQALMMLMAGYDEDEIPEFVKTRALVIPLFGKEKSYITIPYPLGLHVIPNTGRVLAELALNGGKDIGKRTGEAIGEIAGAFNPLGGGNIFTADGALKTVAPTVIDPLIEMGFNKNFAGNSIQREAYGGERDNRPGVARTKEATMKTTTGQAYMEISKAINTMTGGTDYEKGAASPTPEMIRYMAQTVGGGVLREVEKTINASTAASRGEAVKPSGIPVLGRFYGEVDDNQVQMGRYFKTGEKLSKIDSSFKSMVKAGDGEAVQAFVEKNPDIALVQIHRKVGTSIAELNRLAVQTVGDPETLARIDEARVGLMSALNQAAADAGQASRKVTLADMIRPKPRAVELGAN